MSGENVFLLRPGVTTDHLGDPTPDWGNPIRTEITGVGVAPKMSPENSEAGRTPVVVGFDLYLIPGRSTPWDIEISPGDRIEVRGHEYSVDGRPADWTSTPFSDWTPGRVIAVTDKEG